MLELVPLTLANFASFEQDILDSEELFPENIRESAAGYLEALRQERAQGLVARWEGLYAGNVVGFPPDSQQAALLRLEEVKTPDCELLYLFNIVALPQFRGRGLGRELLAAFLDRARQAGFHKVGGHFRGNGSLKNFQTLGGRELGVFDNWFGTGERYTYCELDLLGP